ncbi:MAG: helix-turn-helix transcriptional regulator [Deltaproteobacteria bacterium]|nr:helix-turn-helix transcriptional regulator [Deltaproteobacteria bacterium]
MNNSDFGKRLSFIRKKKGLKQNKAAALVGVSYRAYQRYEGGGNPSPKNLKKLLDYFGCRRAWLLTGEGEPFDEEAKLLRHHSDLLSIAAEMKKREKNRRYKQSNPLKYIPEFGERLASLRKKFGYSQKEMADSMEIDKSEYQRFEEGFRPAQSTVMGLAVLLDDADPSWLYGEDIFKNINGFENDKLFAIVDITLHIEDHLAKKNMRLKPEARTALTLILDMGIVSSSETKNKER